MHLLVTRPKDKAPALMQVVKPWVESVHHQNVVEIKPGPDQHNIVAKLKHTPPDLMIFVSGYAVDYFIAALKDPAILSNSAVQLLAVCKATAAKLKAWSTDEVISPEIETSEGLLQLPQLQNKAIKNHHIVIVRGVGGRELLAEQLRHRGAKVQYSELYQRQAIKGQGPLWYKQWQQWQINCISVTSVAIFDAITTNLPLQAKTWLTNLKWIVPSERVAAHVQSRGVNKQNIIDAKGASNQAILAQVKLLTEN